VEANQSPVRQKPVWISSAMSTMPCSVAKSASRARNPGAGTMKPPSPWMGSITMAATFSTPTCERITVAARSKAAFPSRPSCNGYDIGAR
jgi:hypothetical protein